MARIYAAITSLEQKCGQEKKAHSRKGFEEENLKTDKRKDQQNPTSGGTKANKI